jgi:hypothetical protein
MKEIENIVERQTEKKYLSNFYFHDRAILLWIHKTSLTPPLLLKCLYQVMKVSSHP